MTTVANTLRDAVRTALQGATLATVAAIASDEWAMAEDDGGHVFDGLKGYIRGRNRGRLPFIEFAIQDQSFDQMSATGGMVATSLQVTAHVGGRGDSEAEELAFDLLGAAITAVRSIANSYCDRGSEKFGSFKPSPWGHQLDVTISISHAFGRA